MSVIDIRPYRGGWQCFEAPGVQPYWTETRAKAMAVDYATSRIRAGRGVIRIWNAAGEVEETLSFDGS
jgi:hypothetical protein